MARYRSSNIAYIYAQLAAGLSAALLVYAVCGPATANSEEVAPPKPADIRLVIDVSGSMKRNDPNNLRQPAVELLVQLLPEGSKAGVWTFGKWVNMLVPHREVDDAWRESALKQAKKINSVGLYTNIGEALETAVHDSLKSSEPHHTSMILLTDGMVDIAKQPEENQTEWRRIVDKVLPSLKAAGYTVHTIALSDNADTNLLTKLSLATDGMAEVAHSAEDLMSIFLKAFDLAAPAERVPLTDNQFFIDSSVEEFTALIFRKNPSEQMQLVGPDGNQYRADNPGSEIKWHRADNYDLITVKRPLEGGWGVKGDMAPDSRITVVSNLNLRVAPLPNNLIKGHGAELVLSLREDGRTIERTEFLRLMDIKATMEAGTDEFSLREYWQDTLNSPVEGVYKKNLPLFDKDGIYQLSVVVDGKSFVRQFNHQFNVRPPFDAKVESVFKDGELEYLITAASYNANIDPVQTQVVASVAAPGGRKKIIPLQATGQDTWQASLLPDKEGKYLATIKSKGETTDGQSFSMELEPIAFVYSADKGFIEAEEPFFDEPQVEATPEPKVENTAVEPKTSVEPKASAEQKSPAENNAAVEQEQSSLILYGALALGNLVLLGLGYFAYRKIMGGQSTEDVLDSLSDNTEAESQPTSAKEEGVEQELAEEELEEEPPMEDLDVAEELVAEAEVEEPGDKDDLDPVIEKTEPEPDSAPEPEPEPEPPEEPAAMEADGDASEISDDFDDLERMAMEVPSDPGDSQEVKQDQASEPEDDDMVSAMLKAQGLDLAEEELDDAISSLIDDLQDGDKGD